MDSDIFEDFQHYKDQAPCIQVLNGQFKYILDNQKSNFNDIYSVRFAKEMLDSVYMKYTERKSRFRINFL